MPKAMYSLTVFLVILASGSLSLAEDDEGRTGKAFNIFEIIRFPNDVCVGSSRNGTCYTANECENRGGTNEGSCASGFGVCCVFTVGCGVSTAENCTYFESASITPGPCAAEICPCNDNICQLRLDFTTFVINGPSTSAASVGKAIGGNLLPGVAAGIEVAQASQCLTDTFAVANAAGRSSDVICGTNTGEHLYVDTDTGCTDLVFQFGNVAMGMAAAARMFNIKVTQIACNSALRAPTGCDQYFFGAATNVVRSFNFNGGMGRHLANQDQTICVRRERQYCRICWTTANVADFQLSGVVGPGGFNNAADCCNYGAMGVETNGFDCVNIPGAQKMAATGAMLNSNFCGRGAGLVTPADLAVATTVCSLRTPFEIRFSSDSFEFAAAISEAALNMDTGFQLTYTMDAMNCNDNMP